MPLIGIGVRHFRTAVRKAVALLPDLFLLTLVTAVLGGVFIVGQQMVLPFHEGAAIDLSFWSLPKYTLLSLGRGFAAYGLSLIFTLFYGTIAAHNQNAERFMMPVLDVLQAIPVLGFLPGLVLAMVALFPTRQIGLELACIVMIFTGQVWNMTFSFHASLRNIPQTLREVAATYQLSGWQIFRLLEAPAATIGLVWNSMMSMAGGWFFLTVTEAFTLGNKDFRLPGIGSYMNEAILKEDALAMMGAIFGMTAMIVFVDQLFWRPLVVWSQRFKTEETPDSVQPKSWVLNLLQRSRIYQQKFGQGHRAVPTARVSGSTTKLNAGQSWNIVAIWAMIRSLIKWISIVSIIIGVGFGLWSILKLLVSLPVVDSETHEDWLTVILSLFASFLRTTAAVVLSAAWTLPVGILIGLSAKWSQRLQPVLQVVASFPAPMIFPLVTMMLVFLGVPFNIGCVALLLLGAQWYILFNVIAGARAIPAELKEVAEAFGMSPIQRWIRLYIPCVFPHLVTGLITATGGAWNATIVSEFVQLHGTTYSAFGLGSTISHATATGQYPLLCASVMLMAFWVVLVNRVFWKRLYRIAENRFSLNA